MLENCGINIYLLFLGEQLSHIPLVIPEQVSMPPSHIKLGEIKKIMNAIDKNYDRFFCFKSKSLKLGNAKLKREFYSATNTITND